MNIGRIIYNLRQEKGYTQKKLANLLGVSTGAVSKWEIGNSYPDITLIPKLADIFNVSTDYLFERKEALYKNVDEIINETKKLNINEAIEFLNINLERYPNNSRLMYELAWNKCQLAKESNPDSIPMKEAEKLFEKLTHIIDDDEIRAHSLDRLSKISLLRKDYEKALYYNNKIMPPNGLYPRSENAIIKLQHLDNNEALENAQETLYRNIYEYSNTLYWVLNYYYKHNMYKEGLDEVTRGIKLFELFNQTGLFFQDLSIYHEYSAYIHALCDEYNASLDNLELASEYAVKCDTTEKPRKYKLFGNIVDEKDISYNERKDLLSTLLSDSRNVYNPIKETERFKAIIFILNNN